MAQDLLQFLVFVLALIVTLTVHEASHALTAYYLGDPTAKLNGRLSLNPIRHLDPIGSLVFLVTQTIGWGKPVPVNERNFKNPLRDNALTALAGPVSNFLLAFALALPLKYLANYLPEALQMFMWMVFNVSIFLGIFNLFPLPPLDGSKIIGLFVPHRYAREYANFLSQGVKYFIAIILFDVLIVGGIFGTSIFSSIMLFLYDKVKFILLLGT